MKSRKQAVLLWQVSLAGVILLHCLHLLSSYLKRDFEKSKMGNMKKNDELNRVPYLTIAQAHEVGINQSAGSQGQTYPFQTCSLCIVSSLDSSLSFGQGYFQTDSSPGCANTMMPENRRQLRDRKWPEQSGWLLVLALHSRGAKAGEGKSWTLEFA